MDILNSLKEISILVAFLVSGIIILVTLVMNLTGIPFVPTGGKKMNKMLEIADLKPEYIVYDLGSGDGRFVIEASKRVKEAIGFELNPFLNIYAWIMAKIKRRKNASFVTTSFWNADLSKCDVVFVYLLTSAMRKLEDKILKEGKDGLIVVSNTFRFKNIEPEMVLEKEKVYLYRVSKGSVQAKS